MPTNRTRRSRKIKEKIPLDESIERYFLTGEVERNTPAWDLHVSRFFDGGEKREAAWLEHREFLLKKWRGQGLKGYHGRKKECAVYKRNAYR